MRVAVLGGGVIGVCTAYYLARAGLDVTVIERREGPALEASYANAGQVSPGYATPWAAPGVPLKAIKWLFQEHAPLAIRLDGSWAQLLWMATMLVNCTARRYELNKTRMVRLAEYSRDCLRALRADTGIEYEQRTLGTLQIFRSAKQYAGAQRDIEVLEKSGVAFELLAADALATVEPALAGHGGLSGGLRLPNDETGDCHLFTVRLAELARTLGVHFRFGATVDALNVSGGRLTSVTIDGAPEPFDAAVVAFGVHSPTLLRPLDLRLPVVPVKGYSLTIPLSDTARAPRSTVLDETYKIALTRFDERLRVGGMAEVAGFDLALRAKRRQTLEFVTRDLFDGCGDIAAAEFWTGLRPMTPDGTPIVGVTHIPNLYLNTGHGTLGWTMACGSGQLIADLIGGRIPAILHDDLALSRY